jgi:hypothetical protein
LLKQITQPKRASLDKLEASNSTELKNLDKQITKLRTPTQKVIATGRDSLNHSFSYQGVAPSARAGKLILDEPIKNCELPTAEYQRQKRRWIMSSGM